MNATDRSDTNGMLGNVKVQHIMAWYRTGDDSDSDGRPGALQRVVVAVTQTCKQEDDRAALIVTDYTSGAVLFRKVIEKEWNYTNRDERDAPGSARAGCCISIYDEHLTDEGYFNGYDDVYHFQFDNDVEHAQFDALFLKGQELARRYHCTLEDNLIAKVLETGGNRLE
ncbi:hypothetical protein L227DRAFT_562969 [Lentinus tigrinus ALCF2SS1-6]|uniref:Uncharacterized protein n=1 Tax=Lentinus tigrinus ALCF2SS1-6 TaxID=1328759 RepID=A0A5C2SE36_9APHY|nr:hypothetical protein L227DRAFT_562969 [Lentinus tigrinus ALCF2SS1-6]